MKNKRLLIFAVILIALGLTGIFTTTWFGSHRQPRRMLQMPGMMMDGMMGGSMMNRDQMKDMMQKMMPGMVPPGIGPEDLPDPNKAGARLLNRYCLQCHNLPSPAMHTAEEWPQVANRMFARMLMMSDMGGMGMMDIENPTVEERQEILSYLKKHSLKAIAPGALPSPDSRGAIFFKEICSQCHSLPDPKLHFSKDWATVVKRMESNMQAMGRRVVTEEEKKEITDYLMSYAQR